MRVIISIFLVVVLLLSLTLGVDESALVIQDEAFNRAMVAFGLAKGLNAVISLIQGTELSFTPVGVGLNFSIGEVLDPLNDMVERFSWIMLFASVSLGVQKLLLLLSAKLFVQVALGGSVAVTLLLFWVKRIKNIHMLHYALKFFILFLLLRFSAIAFVYTSELLYNSTLQTQYASATLVIEGTKAELEELHQSNSALVKSKDQESVWEKFNSNIDKLKTTLDIPKQLSSLEKSIEDASRNMITLITIFVVQSMLMPLLFLWLLILSVKYLFRIEFNEEKLKLLYNG